MFDIETLIVFLCSWRGRAAFRESSKIDCPRRTNFLLSADWKESRERTRHLNWTWSFREKNLVVRNQFLIRVANKRNFLTNDELSLNDAKNNWSIPGQPKRIAFSVCFRTKRRMKAARIRPQTWKNGPKKDLNYPHEWSQKYRPYSIRYVNGAYTFVYTAQTGEQEYRYCIDLSMITVRDPPLVNRWR